LSGLRRFAQPAQAKAPAEEAIERCELCATPLDERHGHLVDLERRSLVCACRACYLLFTASGAARGRYRAVPDRIHHDAAHPISGPDWESLQIPVGTAFFFRNSTVDRVVGCYPSPGGATECELDLAEWERLASEYPLLRAPEADLEGIFVSRTDAGIEAYLVPISMCYALVGRVRLAWRGLDGGDEVRLALASFLADLRARSSPLPEA
jgi:hypothetical protein